MSEYTIYKVSTGKIISVLHCDLDSTADLNAPTNHKWINKVLILKHKEL